MPVAASPAPQPGRGGVPPAEQVLRVQEASRAVPAAGSRELGSSHGNPHAMPQAATHAQMEVSMSKEPHNGQGVGATDAAQKAGLELASPTGSQLHLRPEVVAAEPLQQQKRTGFSNAQTQARLLPSTHPANSAHNYSSRKEQIRGQFSEAPVRRGDFVSEPIGLKQPGGYCGSVPDVDERSMSGSIEDLDPTLEVAGMSDAAIHGQAGNRSATIGGHHAAGQRPHLRGTSSGTKHDEVSGVEEAGAMPPAALQQDKAGLKPERPPLREIGQDVNEGRGMPRGSRSSQASDTLAGSAPRSKTAKPVQVGQSSDISHVSGLLPAFAAPKMHTLGQFGPNGACCPPAQLFLDG